MLGTLPPLERKRSTSRPVVDARESGAENDQRFWICRASEAWRAAAAWSAATPSLLSPLARSRRCRCANCRHWRKNFWLRLRTIGANSMTVPAAPAAFSSRLGCPAQAPLSTMMAVGKSCLASGPDLPATVRGERRPAAAAVVVSRPRHRPSGVGASGARG